MNFNLSSRKTRITKEKIYGYAYFKFDMQMNVYTAWRPVTLLCYSSAVWDNPVTEKTNVNSEPGLTRVISGAEQSIDRLK